MSKQASASRTRQNFATAHDGERRHRTTIFLAVFSIADSRRRARVRRILSAVGVQVAPSAFEIPTNRSGVQALERALSLELEPNDTLRLYPICARCRAGTRAWGDAELAGLTPAIFF